MNYLRSDFDPTNAGTVWDGLSANNFRTNSDQIISPDGNDFQRLVSEVRRLQAVLVDHETRIAGVE